MPSLTAWKITPGIQAAVLILLALAVKASVPVVSGALASHGAKAPSPGAAEAARAA